AQKLSAARQHIKNTVINFMEETEQPICRFCGLEEPAGRRKRIEWIECPSCLFWYHKIC
ncbi:hypothetical protein BOX15_Mlig005213g1, partial [Macrostomum lignano]